jgi:WhiB family redox-sensing transcriptional regulator
VKNQHWREDAGCLGRDPRWWFDESNEQLALSICRSCPVRQPCLDHARAQPESWGVWGGTTADERGHNTRRRHGTVSGYAGHRRRGEEPCYICATAHQKAVRESRDGIEHGTRKGYLRHGVLKVPVCEPCAQASREYMAKYRKKAREAACD